MIENVSQPELIKETDTGATNPERTPGESKGTDLTLGNLDNLIDTNDGTAKR